MWNKVGNSKFNMFYKFIKHLARIVSVGVVDLMNRQNYRSKSLFN